MSRLARLAALAALAGTLAACNQTTAPAAGAALNAPSALAVFRGVTVRSGYDPTAATYPYRPYLAIANAGSNDIAIADAIDDTLVTGPFPLHEMVYPLPGRPSLLAAAALGDGGPDLLVAVTAGDAPGNVPTPGGSRLQVVQTWNAAGGVQGDGVELGADILALAPLPFDPAHPGTVQVAAALAGERIAVVTFTRPWDGVTPIDPAHAVIDPAAATTVVSAPLGFQPLDLALLPGERTRIFAASNTPLPGGVFGVAEVSLGGVPAFSRALGALAPTRLVGAAELVEADLVTSIDSPFATALDATAFTEGLTPPPRGPVKRVYAVLDESRCGQLWPIPCGLVAIDVDGSGTLLPDPTSASTMQAPYRAPIQIPGIRALATSGPPAQPPDAGEPQYGGAYLRVAVTPGWRQTTAAAGVASADGLLTFVDLGRWDVPSEQTVMASLKPAVTTVRPRETPGNQWLVLQDGSGTNLNHLDRAGLPAAVGVTAGYTPAGRWIVTREGILPNLQGRRAEVGWDAAANAPWLALQQTATDGSGRVSSAVALWDPTLGVSAGDTVVIDPTGFGTCAEFEARVKDVQPPDASRPGGFVHLEPRLVPTTAGTPSLSVPVPLTTQAKWKSCVDELETIASVVGPPFFSASFRAADFVLHLASGPTPIYVGRPSVGTPFQVSWVVDGQSETALAAACPLPPAVQWDPHWGQPGGTAPPACDDACRRTCQQLVVARLGRRLFYLPEAPANQVGPALSFVLGLEQGTAVPVPRDLQLIIDTVDGRGQFRAIASTGSSVDPRAVVPFDRSPWFPRAGIRFIVPFAGGIVLDGTPTNPAPDTSYTFH